MTALPPDSAGHAPGTLAAPFMLVNRAQGIQFDVQHQLGSKRLVRSGTHAHATHIKAFATLSQQRVAACILQLTKGSLKV